MSFVLWWRAFWRALWVMCVFPGDSTFQSGRNSHSQGAETQRKTIKVHSGRLMKYIKMIRAHLLGRDCLFLSTLQFLLKRFLSPNWPFLNYQSTCGGKKKKKLLQPVTSTTFLFAALGVLKWTVFLFFSPLRTICDRLLFRRAVQEWEKSSNVSPFHKGEQIFPNMSPCLFHCHQHSVYNNLPFADWTAHAISVSLGRLVESLGIMGHNEEKVFKMR